MQITNKDLHLEVNSGWLFLIQNLPVNKIDNYYNINLNLAYCFFTTVQDGLEHWSKYFILHVINCLNRLDNSIISFSFVLKTKVYPK